MNDLGIGFIIGFILTVITAFLIFSRKSDSIKSDHPLTPHKEIKVDSKGDSTITYIYKLD